MRCPRSGQRLALAEAEHEGDRIRSGVLVSVDGRHRYPVRDYIPRFVPASNYADSFGMQWNRFRTTQLDSHSGQPVSAERFWKATGWRPEQLAGKWVLDAGCGAGRFAEVALQAGAKVVALDYSSAADACLANLGPHVDLHVVQGDLFAVPFAEKSFAFVYSLGVLQHTPDVARAFAGLPRMLEDGGRLCADFYEKSWKSLVQPRYWLRPLTRRLPPERLFAALETLVPPLLAFSRAAGRVPLVGSALKRLVPVADPAVSLPFSESLKSEWALLDTFDWLSPRHDHPQRSDTVMRWLREAGLEEPQVLKAGHLVARGRMPHAPRH